VSAVLVVGDVINDVIVLPAGATAVDSDTAAGITAAPGGSGANQAAWLAALGVPVRLAARVGAADADTHRQLLAGAGVDPHLSVDPDLATGSIVVVVGEGATRSMYTDRGANARLNADDLDARDLLDGVSHLHVSGYALIDPAARAAVSDLWRSAGHLGLTRSVDVGSAASLGPIGPRLRELTEGADVIFANLSEGRLVMGLGEGADGYQVVAELRSHYSVVVLKLGSEGAIIATETELVAAPPPDGMIVDPTGAGDAFCAGYLGAWLEGASPATASASATGAAARAMATIGGRPPPATTGPTLVTADVAPPDRPLPREPPWLRLRRAARSASSMAYAPYSHLGVGAAGITDEGTVLVGCNVENASFGLSLCAECGLVSALRAAGGQRLVAVSVVAQDGEPLAPCGRCRQLLLDNGGRDLLIDRGPGTDPARLGDLLPGAFGAGDLSSRRSP
jgi:homotetrameric cytidine deaminase